MPREHLVQVRRGTAAAWTTANPILASGEAGLETDTLKLKYGDGETEWADLDYVAGGGAVDPDTTLLGNPITALELDALSGISSNVQTQLDGKAATSHSHAIADTTGLQAALDAKQATGNYITALTGDVTAAGPGSSTATIADDAVTLAKIQNISTARLLGRYGVGSGDVQQIAIGSGLSLNGSGVLSSSGGAASSQVVDVTDYGALGDGVEVLDGATTGSSTTFTSATASFQPEDVGKTILIDGVGASSGFGVVGGVNVRAPLLTTIAARTNSTTITLSAPAQVTATGCRFVYGTDDTAAIQDALDTTITLQGGHVVFPANRIFFASSTLTIWRYGSGSQVYTQYGGGRYGNVRISGYGAYIISSAATVFQVQAADVASIYHEPIIEGMVIEGLAGTSQIGIQMSHTFCAVIRDVRVRRIGIGVDLIAGLQDRLQNVMIEYCTTYGFRLRSAGAIPCNATVLDGCRVMPVNPTVASFYLEDTDMCEIRNGVSEGLFDQTEIEADIVVNTTNLATYPHVLRVCNFYSEIHTFSGALVKVVNNGSVFLENFHRYPAPDAPLVDATGSGPSTIVLRDWKFTIDGTLSTVNSMIRFTQNVANTVGWIFENMGEFATSEARDLTTTEFWTSGTRANKITQIEPGQVRTRNV